ncbi:hypothetical protein EV421DRAFT_1690807, partial [Armillaria borealis]
IPNIIIAHKFIEQLQTALLDNLDPEIQIQISNPFKDAPDLTPVECLSIDTFLAVTNASQKAYKDIRNGYLCCHPNEQMLSYYQVKKLIQDLSGITPVAYDMCINSCAGF